MKNLILILSLVFSIFSNSANAQMSELKFEDTTTVKVTGDFVEGQNIDTFRDYIGLALNEKYGYPLDADASLKNGCDNQLERKAKGNVVPTGDNEGRFYSVNMTSHNPIETYPPSYVAERFIGTMEDRSESYYDGLQLLNPTKYWAELYQFDGQYYLIITLG